ncbi:MAG: NAD(P)-dependent oxidoreductase [Sphingomonas sp.]|uniref:NAD-dependent epimerase/dehydratase family protein n=1 Tax=Sphingomonas sp. TaxID=28214 RepID=UPI0017ED16A5|nr:NAD(P)-dependent oxidoreductase [Sphingomonas sp.]MBA3666937.1 NAD(P)-dependent oxidoreductase [Sphingomonas sp.]
MKRVMITGAMGRIGRVLSNAFREKFRLVLIDRAECDIDLGSQDEFISIDIVRQELPNAAFLDVDAIIHLAAIPHASASFDELLPANILATQRIYEQASKFNIRRLVFASSAQVIEGYPLDLQLRSDVLPKPANLYGATKAFGEALGAYYASLGTMSVVALRIGAFEPYESPNLLTLRDLTAWLSPRDAIQLFQRALEAPVEGFLVANGISNNRLKRLALDDTRRRLGYEPQDDAFSAFPELLSKVI